MSTAQNSTVAMAWNEIDAAGVDCDYIEQINLTWDGWDSLPSFPYFERNDQIELPVGMGKTYFVAIVCDDVNLIEFHTMTLGYDPAALELVNFASHVEGVHTEAGEITGTELVIVSHDLNAGGLRFNCNKEIPTDREWSGIVTLMEFEALATGNTQLTLS